MTRRELESLFVENGGAVELTDTLWISDYGHKYQLFVEDEEAAYGYTLIRRLSVEETIEMLVEYGKVGK